MDHLVLGPFVLDKSEQPTWRETENWQTTFQLD
jgi:carbamoyltransferase